MALMGATLSLSAFSQSTTVTSQPDADYAGPRLPIRVSNGMTANDFAAVIEQLGASEAQRACFERFFDVYTITVDTLKEKHRAALARLSIEGGKASQPYFTAAGADIQELLCHEESAYMDGLQAADVMLFDQMAAGLADMQAAHLERLRLRRSRDYCQLDECMMLGARVDLSRLIEMVADSESRSRVDDIVVRYEIAVTPLLVSLDKDFRKARAPFYRICVEEQSLASDQSADAATRRESLFQQRKRLFARQARLQRQVVAMNDRYASELAAALGQPLGQEVLRVYKGLAYHRIYADELDPTVVLDTVIASAHPSAERRGEIEAVRAALEATRGDILKQMEREFNDWRERFAGTLSSGDAEEGAYRARLRALRSKLWEADQTIVAQVTSMLAVDQEPTPLLEYRKMAQRVIEDGAKDRFPGS